MGQEQSLVKDLASENKFVVQPRIIFDTKTDAGSKVGKDKRRFVAKRVQQVQGLDYQEEEVVPTPAAAGIRMIFATAAELRAETWT